MIVLRTPETEEKYQEYMRAEGLTAPCSLCEKVAVKEFAFWKVVENIFPYDKVAKTHHMLVPIRHVQEKELTQEEKEEFALIKESFVNPNYDWIIEMTRKKKSIPGHFHVHLIVGKES